MLDESYEACKKYLDDAELAEAVVFNLSLAIIEIIS